jgi:hypothetical protein
MVDIDDLHATKPFLLRYDWTIIGDKRSSAQHGRRLHQRLLSIPHLLSR